MKRIEHGLEIFIFNSRWLLAPFYVGLIIAIGLLLVKFMKSFLAALTVVFEGSSGDAMLATDRTLHRWLFGLCTRAIALESKNKERLQELGKELMEVNFTKLGRRARRWSSVAFTVLALTTTT